MSGNPPLSAVHAIYRFGGERFGLAVISSDGITEDALRRAAAEDAENRTGAAVADAADIEIVNFAEAEYV